ncbi:MAG: hypothetical protein PHH93_12385, partial [Prolixibacteraceae bacterium]|nr:hypothetical protein [Prolixibacteraceae bacterium]
MKNISRRKFVKSSVAASLFTGLAVHSASASADERSGDPNSLRVGIIGTGNRGISLMRQLLKFRDVEIAAVCDLLPERAENAASVCNKAGNQKPKMYYGNPDSWKKMIDSETLDAVII